MHKDTLDRSDVTLVFAVRVFCSVRGKIEKLSSLLNKQHTAVVSSRAQKYLSYSAISYSTCGVAVDKHTSQCEIGLLYIFHFSSHELYVLMRTRNIAVLIHRDNPSKIGKVIVNKQLMTGHLCNVFNVGFVRS